MRRRLTPRGPGISEPPKNHNRFIDKFGRPRRHQMTTILINNFLCMRHRKAESVWLYLDHLKGAAKHWDFNLPTGHTSFTNKMFLHTLVQGLEYAATAKDDMEEYGTNNDLQNHIKVSNYHKGQNLELHRSIDNPRSNAGKPREG